MRQPIASNLHHSCVSVASYQANYQALESNKPTERRITSQQARDPLSIGDGFRERGTYEADG
jgi:hypothetical protein